LPLSPPKIVSPVANYIGLNNNLLFAYFKYPKWLQNRESKHMTSNVKHYFGFTVRKKIRTQTYALKIVRSWYIIQHISTYFEVNNIFSHTS